MNKPINYVVCLPFGTLQDTRERWGGGVVTIFILLNSHKSDFVFVKFLRFCRFSSDVWERN